MAERPATIPALGLTARYFEAELERLSRPDHRTARQASEELGKARSQRVAAFGLATGGEALQEPSHDVRLVLCEACGSEGRILRSNGGPDDTDYGPCPYCEGTGEELVTVEPVTEAEAMCADADAAHELRALGINCVDPFDARSDR